MTKAEIQQILHDIVDQGDNRALKILWATTKKYDLHKTKADQPSDQTLYRLVYTSARSSQCTEKDIEEILEASRKNNAELDITGILLYTSNRFVQIIEGPHDSVMQLYNKLQRDTRHGGSTIRFSEAVSTRHFSDWNMAQKNIHTKDLEYKANISLENKKVYESLIDGDLHNYQDDGIRVLKTFLSIA